MQLDTLLSFKIASVGHSNSPVKAITIALPALSDRRKKNPYFYWLYSFVNYKAAF